MGIKRTVIGAVFAASLLAAAAIAETYTTVGTNSVQLCARKPIRTASAWVASTAYTSGDITSNGGNYYMAVGSGTSSTNAPTHTNGDTSDGSVTWRWTSPSTRNGIVISMKTSGGKADLSFTQQDAVASGGLRLYGEGAAIIFSYEDDFQGEIHAICPTAGTNVVLGVQEF